MTIRQRQRAKPGYSKYRHWNMGRRGRETGVTTLTSRIKTVEKTRKRKRGMRITLEVIPNGGVSKRSIDARLSQKAFTDR